MKAGLGALMGSDPIYLVLYPLISYFYRVLKADMADRSRSSGGTDSNFSFVYAARRKTDAGVE